MSELTEKLAEQHETIVRQADEIAELKRIRDCRVRLELCESRRKTGQLEMLGPVAVYSREIARLEHNHDGLLATVAWREEQANAIRDENVKLRRENRKLKKELATKQKGNKKGETKARD